MINTDLLKTIYDATISLPIKTRIVPNNSKEKKVTISPYYSNSNIETISLNDVVSHFEYKLSPLRTSEKSEPMLYTYTIDLYKTKEYKLLWFVTKKSKYVLKVRITESKSYTNTFKAEYLYKNDTLIKKIYSFLVERDIELKKQEESEIISSFVLDLSKSVDKSIKREDALNKIFDK